MPLTKLSEYFLASMKSDTSKTSGVLTPYQFSVGKMQSNSVLNSAFSFSVKRNFSLSLSKNTHVFRTFKFI